VIFHVRTLMEGDEGILCAAVRGLFGGE